MGDPNPNLVSVFSPRQIYLASFIGGPLSGAWFLSRNFRAVSNAPAGNRSLVVGVFAVIAMFPLLLVLPEKFPNHVIPIAYSAAFYYFAKPRFAVDAARGIGFSTGWRHWVNVIGISIFWMGLTLAFWVGGGVLLDRLSPGVHPGSS